ncbi:DUF1642 domain-containing protein [Streptococcus sp. VTCC 12886]|uniref:DUF1642 domain-containing protein n=1 Tax=Streptococcus sp. VTCC 12886 TaxID=3413767 RepID=UPI003D9C6FFC
MVIKNEVLAIISKIDEPKKVVVPAFIDRFIGYAKAEGMSLFIAMDNAQNKELEWIITNEETFARAWLDGYEIEQERLYVVNLGKIVGLSIYLRKIGKSLHSDRGDWSTTGDIRFAERLTETEIKQKDERLWQFAESVKLNWSKSPEDIQANIDTKADQELTQQQLNLLVKKAQLMQTELEAKVAMETLSDLERAYKSYVEANDKAVAKSQADLIEAGRRVDAMVETLEVGNDIEV